MAVTGPLGQIFKEIEKEEKVVVGGDLIKLTQWS